jgi:histidine triad (HIT) family protein
MVTQQELEQMSPEQIAALQKENCIFCKIVKGEISANKVYEDDLILGFMDINPARKGHVLLIPKEHYQIFPLIEPAAFKQLFKQATLIGKIVQKICLTQEFVLFAANGGVAGQQISHAVLHVMPKEQSDGITSLDIPQRPETTDFNNQLIDALKQNLPLMFKNHLQREGRMDEGQSQDVRREHIAKVIEENQEVRSAIMHDPEGFKALLTQHNELGALFMGVDIDKLSQHLNDEESTKDSTKESTDSSIESEKPSVEELNEATRVDSQLQQNNTVELQEEIPDDSLPTLDQSQSQDVQESSSQDTITNLQSHRAHLEDLIEVPQANTQPAISQEETAATQLQTSTVPSEEKTNKEENSSSQSVFLGADPQAQEAQLNDYFTQKPQAKALFMNSLDDFKHLLEDRPDVQPIFADIHLERLQKKLQQEGNHE